VCVCARARARVCVQKCGASVRRADMFQHAEVCPFTRRQCAFKCGTELYNKEMSMHESACTQRCACVRACVGVSVRLRMHKCVCVWVCVGV
jgi:hypothetical protein